MFYFILCSNTYDALGRLATQCLDGGSHNDFEESVTTLMVRDYCGNKEYRNGVLDRIHNDYGYWSYIYVSYRKRPSAWQK